MNKDWNLPNSHKQDDKKQRNFNHLSSEHKKDEPFYCATKFTFHFCIRAIPNLYIVLELFRIVNFTYKCTYKRVTDFPS